jgi:outer membrane protein assembly factor BamB
MRENLVIVLLIAILVGLALFSPGHDLEVRPQNGDGDDGGTNGTASNNSLISCSTSTPFNFSSLNLIETWSVSGDKVIFSSPNSADLNGDNILDIIIGSGSEEEQVGAVQAIDGETGVILWKVDTQGEMIGMSTLIYLNDDSTPDIVAGGRNHQLIAVDGADGTVLWRFNETDTAQEKWYQFYTGVDVGDIDGDGIHDILQSNGGDPLKAAAEERPVGSLVIISGADGHAITSAMMPDGRETYMSPIVVTLNPQNSPTVIFGSGGETFPGSLWSIPLIEVVNGTLSNATELIPPTVTKGVIAPPSLADINGDGTIDIIAALFDGRLVAVNGANNSIMWTISIGGESYSSPAIGVLDDDNSPDSFIPFLSGAWPDYTGAEAGAVASNGSVLLARHSDSSALSSPLAVDLNGDGRDEIILIEGEAVYPSGSSHSISIIDACTGEESKIWNGTGFPISTPIITDLDSDGDLEIIWAASEFEGGWTVRRGEMSASTPETISWGGYLGTNHNGQFTS